MRIESSIEVAASPELVFDRLLDWRAHPLWMPTLESVEAPDEIAAGARLVEVRAAHGQRLTFDVTVREVDRPRRVHVTGRSRGAVQIEAGETFGVEPAGERSRVTMAVEARLPLVLLPIRHAVAVETEKEIERSLANLRAQVEAESNQLASS